MLHKAGPVHGEKLSFHLLCNSPQENNSVPKECLHGSFSLPFQIKARPCRWCNCWCQVGAARRLCCSQQAGWGYPAAQGFVLHGTSPKATLGEWRSTGSSPPGLPMGPQLLSSVSVRINALCAI